MFLKSLFTITIDALLLLQTPKHQRLCRPLVCLLKLTDITVFLIPLSLWGLDFNIGTSRERKCSDRSSVLLFLDGLAVPGTEEQFYVWLFVCTPEKCGDYMNIPGKPDCGDSL